MTKVDLLHNLRVKFNELSLREYVIVEEATNELLEDLKHKKIAIQNRKARIKDLEKQIEKMKCCENCNNFKHRIDHRCNTECKNLSKWEMKENE